MRSEGLRVMKAFIVRYSGLWLGGKAVVLAESEIEAIELVGLHRSTINFLEPDRKPQVEEVPAKGVIYNDNGDY